MERDTRILGRQKQETVDTRYEIRAVDKANWITLCKNLALLKASTAIEAEAAGAHILTEVLNLIFRQQMNVDMVTECIHRITDEVTNTKQ